MDSATPSIAEQPQAAVVDESKLREELKGWHKAREEANRHNRNLLQYGAGVATAFGVGAGAGGILAIANSLARSGIDSLQFGSFLFWVLGGVFLLSYVAIAIAAILTVLLIFAYFRRRAAESEVTTHLENLVFLLPYHFLPAREERVSQASER